MKRSSSVERLSFFLSSDAADFQEAARELINTVRPKWKGCELQFKVFTDGITNRLVGCYVATLGTDDMLLLRIYGEKTELFIDRELEIRNMCAMHTAGLAPPLYAIFQNGVCYGYTPGIPLDENLVRDPSIYLLVGEMLARMHTVKPKARKHSVSMKPHHPHHIVHAHRTTSPINGAANGHSNGNNGVLGHGQHASNGHTSPISSANHPPINGFYHSSIDPQPSLFRAIRRFLQLMPISYADETTNQRFLSIIPPREKLEAELSHLEAELSALDSPIVFCHNDLLMKNIILSTTQSTNSTNGNNTHRNNQNQIPNSGDDSNPSPTRSITFIDFEYADYNYQAFDIGNHFCEFCGVEPFNPGRYPDRATQIRWLTNYLESWHSLTHYEVLTHDLSAELRNLIRDQVEVLYVHVNKFALAAHLFWGIWSLIQAANSKINFDFLQYGAQRINEYFARRDEFLHLKAPKSSL